MTTPLVVELLESSPATSASTVLLSVSGNTDVPCSDVVETLRSWLEYRCGVVLKSGDGNYGHTHIDLAISVTHDPIVREHIIYTSLLNQFQTRDEMKQVLSMAIHEYVHTPELHVKRAYPVKVTITEKKDNYAITLWPVVGCDKLTVLPSLKFIGYWPTVTPENQNDGVQIDLHLTDGTVKSIIAHDPTWSGINSYPTALKNLIWGYLSTDILSEGKVE